MKKKIKKNQIMITALALMIAVAGYMQFSGNNLSKEELADGTNGVEGVSEDGYLSELDSTSGEEGYLTELDIVTDEEEVVTMLDMDLSGVNMDTLDTYVTTDDVVAQMENGLSDEQSADGMVSDNTAAETPSPSTGTPGEAVYTSSPVQMSLTDAKLLKEQSRAQNKAGLLEIINNSQLADSAKQSAVERLVTLTDIAERELAAEILLEAKGFTGSIVSISGETVDIVLSSTDLTDAKRAQIEDIVTRKTGITSDKIIISSMVEN